MQEILYNKNIKRRSSEPYLYYQELRSLLNEIGLWDEELQMLDEETNSTVQDKHTAEYRVCREGTCELYESF